MNIEKELIKCVRKLLTLSQFYGNFIEQCKNTLTAARMELYSRTYTNLCKIQRLFNPKIKHTCTCTYACVCVRADSTYSLLTIAPRLPALSDSVCSSH